MDYMGGGEEQGKKWKLLKTHKLEEEIGFNVTETQGSPKRCRGRKNMFAKNKIKNTKKKF